MKKCRQNRQVCLVVANATAQITWRQSKADYQLTVFIAVAYVITRLGKKILENAVARNVRLSKAHGLSNQPNQSKNLL